MGNAGRYQNNFAVFDRFGFVSDRPDSCAAYYADKLPGVLRVFADLSVRRQTNVIVGKRNRFHDRANIVQLFCNIGKLSEISYH